MTRGSTRRARETRLGDGMSDGERQKRRYSAIRVETLRRTTYHVWHGRSPAQHPFIPLFMSPCKEKRKEDIDNENDYFKRNRQIRT